MPVTITEESGAIQKIKFEWTSAADGTASGETSGPYTGELLMLATVPGAGADAPTDNYDITVTDEDDIDVLAGAGANRSATVAQQVLAASLGCVSNEKLTLNISNAGDSKSGTVYLFIR